MKIQKAIINKNWLIYLVIPILVSACNEDFLEKFPQDQLSEGTFWNTEGDALLALTGVYSVRNNNEAFHNGQENYDHATDNGYDQFLRYTVITETGNNPTYFVSSRLWNRSYSKITASNIFLENIQSVDMDEAKKAEIIAEVRFQRAYAYFWMSQYFGGVPLIVKSLSIDEANAVSRDTKAEIVNFVLQELTAAANDLPATRPASEHGRILKGAALGMKGRLLMAEKNWSEAATSFKQVIDLGVHTLHPEYFDLFIRDGETVSEIMLSRKQIDGSGANTFGHAGIWVNSLYKNAGQHQTMPSQDLVDAYLMNDGLSIEDSPLYDEQNPYDNRDPRLYATILLPGYSFYQGELYQAHPDSVDNADRIPGLNGRANGYSIYKFLDETVSPADWLSYGGDHLMMRYGEVLLSYLEASVEAGNINQGLLDQTINLIRARASVNMPAVTETDPVKLREIVRRERRVELAFEGLRLWDLYRWEIAMEIMNVPMLGMRITFDPLAYTGPHTLNADGFYIVYETTFVDKNWLWPIPQAEIDINPNLTQNPGY